MQEEGSNFIKFEITKYVLQAEEEIIKMSKIHRLLGQNLAKSEQVFTN